MPVIRCPNCGKPNPNFLDTCQYCDQVLKEPGAAGVADAAEASSEGTIRKSLIVRCPKCGKSNPDVMEACQYCGTPLKGAAAEASEAEPAEIPDWLQALRGDAPAGEEAEAEAPLAPAAETPDWLQALQADAAPADAAPAEDVPDWLKSLQSETPETPVATSAASAAELPDWLKPPAPAVKTPAPPVDDVPDWLNALQTEAPAAAAAPEADLPDWLKPPAAPQPSASAPADAEIPDWLQPAAEPAAAGEAMPDWLKTATGPLKEHPVELAPNEDLPDWLRTATGPLKETSAPEAAPIPGTAPFAEPTALPSEGLPDWLSGLAPAAGLAADEDRPALSASAPLPAILPSGDEPPDLLTSLRGSAAPAAEDDQPDWLKSLGLPEAAEDAPRGAGLAAAAPAEEEPDWMRSLRSDSPPAEAAPAEPEPDWLAALRTEPGASAASVEPAISPFAAEPAAEPAANEPDWLAGLRPSAPAPAAPLAGAGGPGLAQGELPSWLAAMRPVDIQQSTAEPEVDEYEETVGVLAGMRGVLRAEPGVVLPGKSAAQVHMLAYTPAQAKQAELLAGILVGDRAAPAAKGRARALSVPWERWLVALVLVLGLLLPPFALPGLFPLPTTIPAETLSAFQALAAAPAGRPVLVAFDYEPGQAGELGLIADAVVGHVIRRGLPLVAVSTSLTGAGVAQETLDRLTTRTGYADAVTYLNLGYLPGGPVGIQQFVQFPQSVFRADFAGRQTFPAQGDLWSLPLLQGLASLNDFGAVIVLSAAPDDARAWIEQTAGMRAPLVLAVSAGVAPLVRPYVEADQTAARAAQQAPHLAGLVSGAAGSVQYEQQAGVFVPDPLLIRWEMLGGGLLTSALLLVLGNAAHGVRRAVRGAGRGKA